MEGSDLVLGVTCERPFDWTPPRRPTTSSPPPPQRRARRTARRRLRLRDEVEHPAPVQRVRLRRSRLSGDRAGVGPARRRSPTACSSATAPAIRRRCRYAIDNAKALVDADVPVFGICLGHQVLSLAMGGETFKLKFGHRGANHPVKELDNGKVEITSQNHGFAVDPESLPADVRGDARQPVRRHGRRAAAHRAAGLLRAVPSRGVARARTTRTTCSGSSSMRWNGASRQLIDVSSLPRCPSVPTSSACSSSAPVRSSSARRASSTTRARRPARR